MIRKAVKEDLPKLYEILDEAIAFMRSYGNTAQWGNGVPHCLLEGDIEKGELYVLTENQPCKGRTSEAKSCEDKSCEVKAEKEEILGLFALIYGKDPMYETLYDGEWQNDLPYSTIHRMAFSNKGRGKSLAKEAIDFAMKQYGNVYIDTHPTNAPMLKCVEKNDFKRCGTIIFEEDHTPRIVFSRTADLVLASQSPRRKQLMKCLGRNFVVCPSQVEEIVPKSITTEQTAEFLAGLKAEDVFKRTGKAPVTVIGSDTIVDVDGVILGKPADEKDAYRMLKMLSGRSHFVRTGVMVIKRDEAGNVKRESFTSVTKVTFFDLTDDEINAYIKTGKPMDKAGAYGIQDGSELFVKSIEGDYFTVVGLPIGEVARRI